MVTDYNTTAVAFADMKNAALYFDYIIPVYFVVELYTKRPEFDSLEGLKHDLLPPHLLSRPGFAERLTIVNEATSNLFLKLAIQRFELPPKIGGVSEDRYRAIEDEAVSQYFSFIDDYNLKKYPVASVGGGVASAWMDDDEQFLPDPVVTLTDLKVIDASRVPWEHLIDFRQDREARNKLRKLRLFAYNNYIDRPRAYIEDDIFSRVADYEETVRQWGFETVQGTFNVVLNSKLTASLIAGTFLSSLFGQPANVLLSAAASVAVELGHIGVELSRRRFALKKFMRDSPISFVSYSQEKLHAPGKR